MAYDATPYQEFEDRAWLLTQMAHLNLIAGNLEKAETVARGALELFPNNRYALETLGQIRMAQAKFAEAADVAAPHAENLYALAEALERAGRHAQPETSFALFEQKALAESTIAGYANHELIAYYADYAGQSANALRLAEQELAPPRRVHPPRACLGSRCRLRLYSS